MTLRAWAELLRVSALFTVPGDALAGAASAGVRPNRGTALAVGASLCMYEAGMALNDWADRDEDAVERPHRPIPSGRITPNAALAAAGGLTATGLLLASRAGRPSLALTTALAATVWAYDLRLKHTAAGPAAMGAARALDVLLGATATASASRRTLTARVSKPGSDRTPVAASPSELTASAAPRRGVLSRLSAWATGSGRTSPVGHAGGSAPGGFPAGQADATPSVGALAGRLAGSAPRPAVEAAASTARTSASEGRAATPVSALAGKFAGSGPRPAVEAAASTARFPELPAERGVLALLSAWADGSAGQARPAVEAAASSARFPAPPGGSASQGRNKTLVSALAGKFAGSGPRPVVEAAASTARYPAAPGTLRGKLAPPALEGGASLRFSAPPGGSAGNGRMPAGGPGGWPDAVPRRALLPAALLGAHTVAVTGVSRSEVYGGAVGAPLAALALTGVLGGVVGRPQDVGVAALVTAGLAAAYAVTAGRPFLHAALNPSPQLTQRAVGGGIRAMIPFQAALAARGGSPAIGLVVMGLVPLARKFAKKVSVT
ncbi:UbiA family prenyltransferase [Streptomyces sp. NBC_01716]|nr:UbiA family prenyltransferase [Streptomyces sp. NBC_01716]